MSREIKTLRHNKLRKEIGRNVKMIRKQAGLTQSELAELVEASSKQISQIEQGISFPGLGLLGDISTALNTPIKSFFTDIAPTESEVNFDRHQAAFHALPQGAQKIVEHLTWELVELTNTPLKKNE